MKILVTGSEGSLMQAVIPLLLKQGHIVRGVDNFSRYGVIERTRNYEFIRDDLTNPSFADSAVKGMDVVIQAAASIYGIGGFHKYRADILLKDLTLHQNILLSMIKHNVPKIAYISSSMVYEQCRQHPSKESDAFEAFIPQTDYGLSKLVGERMVIASAKQYGIKFVLWRPFNIITPHEKGENEQGMSHVFADMIRNIVINKANPLPIIGDGEQIRCFTWIQDVASGIAEHSFSSNTDNEIFNLGNPEPITVKQLATLIFKTAQKLSLIEKTDSELQFHTSKSYSLDVKKRIPNVDKAKAILHWTPTKKVADSVALCLEKM